MKKVPLNTWEEFEAKIASHFEDIKKKKEENKYLGDIPVFRGQEDSLWKLETTLERYTSQQYTEKEYHCLMLSIKSTVESFTDKPWDISDYDETVDEIFPHAPQGYEFMAYLRHHGFPTPLLDWTRSPYIAAFFAFRAVDKNLEGNVAIFSYVERPEGVKGGTGRQARIDVAGSSITTHKRHHIQQCAYTTCKKRMDGKYIYYTHEEAFSRNNPKQDILTKYILPKTERQKVLEKLDLMNINTFSLFGNEEGLMESLAYKYIENKP